MTGGDWDGNWATLPLCEVEEVADFCLTDMPSHMFPTVAKVCIMLAQLATRGDVAEPAVQAAIAQCWDFLEFEIRTCH